MKKRLANGLTAREEQFCRLLCRGIDQSDAYRRAGLGKRLAPSTVVSAASRLAAREQVRARVEQLLQASAVSDLDSIGQAYSDLMADIAKARAAENWTAVSALTRQRLQVLGMLRDTVTVSVENSADDSALLDRLAGGDPARRAALEAVLGRSGFAH